MSAAARTNRFRRRFIQLNLASWISHLNAHASTPQFQTQWQLSPELVARGALKKYRDKVKALQQAQLLDTETWFTQRIRAITAQLATQAAIDYPCSRDWQWEIHSSDQIDENSYGMAGGKIIISRPMVNDYSLNESALAMLIAHEMAHALLLHNFAEDQEALRLFPAWAEKSFEDFETAIDDDDTLIRALASLGKQQEFEADLKGMQLALRAGYAAKGLLAFYEKLRKKSAYPNFESLSHPAPAARLQRLRDWLRQQESPN